MSALGCKAEISQGVPTPLAKCQTGIKRADGNSISSRAFALADQACGCEHDSRDECSYAAIQQDFIKDSGHDSLHSIHLDQTVTAKCYEVDKRCELFTSRPRVAGLQQQIESL